MAITPRLELRQGQSLVMTPQLQQSIKLVQLNNIELSAFIDGEVEKNPLLERKDGATSESETPEPPDGEAADGEPMAVLDARLRVRGVDNLRVSDLSAVPNINAGNTTAPAMMLGDRCVDFILGHDRATPAPMKEAT